MGVDSVPAYVRTAGVSAMMVLTSAWITAKRAATSACSTSTARDAEPRPRLLAGFATSYWRGNVLGRMFASARRRSWRCTRRRRRRRRVRPRGPSRPRSRPWRRRRRRRAARAPGARGPRAVRAAAYGVRWPARRRRRATPAAARGGRVLLRTARSSPRATRWRPVARLERRPCRTRWRRERRGTRSSSVSASRRAPSRPSRWARRLLRGFETAVAAGVAVWAAACGVAVALRRAPAASASRRPRPRGLRRGRARSSTSRHRGAARRGRASRGPAPSRTAGPSSRGDVGRLGRRRRRVLRPRGELRDPRHGHLRLQQLPHAPRRQRVSAPPPHLRLRLLAGGPRRPDRPPPRGAPAPAPLRAAAVTSSQSARPAARLATGCVACPTARARATRPPSWRRRRPPSGRRAPSCDPGPFRLTTSSSTSSRISPLALVRRGLCGLRIDPVPGPGGAVAPPGLGDAVLLPLGLPFRLLLSAFAARTRGSSRVASPRPSFSPRAS